MRVIEDRCPFSVSMAKSKKRAARKAAAAENQYNRIQSIDGVDSDSSLQRKACNHIPKSVNFQNYRKTLKATNTIQCAGCAQEESFKPEGKESDAEIWFCLQCGYQGCSRHSPSQHSLKHWRQPHSDPHNIVLSTSSWVMWCYECDDELEYNTSTHLSNAVSFIKKQLGASKHSRPNSSELGPPDTLLSLATPTIQRRQDMGGGGSVRDKTLPRMKGLSNLGNTCFFNAVIQSLSQVREFNQLLNDMRESDITLTLPGYSSAATSVGGSDYEDSSDGDDSKPSELVPINIQLGKESMTLTDSLIKLFRDMTAEDVPRQTLNPCGLFDQICRRVPRFKGYQQQDSHELLRNLLDSLKNEELKRIQAGILTSFNYKSLDEQAKKQVVPKIKSYGQQARHTAVDSLFGGYLLSTVLCNECSRASQIFEPFLDLSLPVYEEKGRHSSARKASQSTTAEDFTTGEDVRGHSKHQQKKAARDAKRNKKSRNRVGVTEATNGPSTQAHVPLISTVKNKCEAPQKNCELDVVEAEAGSCGALRRRASSSAAAGSDRSRTSSCSSRCPTPKSELGYNSDSEGSTDAAVNGILPHSTEKLPGIANSCAIEKSASLRARYAVEMSLKPLSEKVDRALHDCSIQSALGHFTHPELLTGPNKFACTFCNRKAKKNASSSKDKPRTVYTDARKQMIIYSPPTILTLHLKRFQQLGVSFSKVNKHVDFGLGLDLAPYCSTLAQGVEPGQTSIQYLLFAVVEHSGKLNGGHYTAYVRQRSSATLDKNALQKSLYNEKPLNLLMERVSKLQRDLEMRDNIDRYAEVCSADISTAANSDPAQIEPLPIRHWYHISDTHVKEVSEKSVLNSQAYLLFYERVR